jgi:hypothetical protein
VEGTVFLVVAMNRLSYWASNIRQSPYLPKRDQMNSVHPAEGPDIRY